MDRAALFPFLGSLSPRAQKELGAIAPTRARPSATLLTRGAACGGAYLVLQGALRVYYLTEEGREATLDQWNAYGVFAVGVQVRDAKGRWVSLELDLATLPNLPRRFLKR